MKSSALFLLLCISSLEASATGQVTLLRHLFIDHGVSGGNYYSSCWGYTDSSGREYALMGAVSGLSIVDISNPATADEVAFIPGPISTWREIKTHGHYAYVVSEAGGGTQIIDLSGLPDTARLVQNFVHASGNKNTTRVHTISIHDGYMYLNGCAFWSPGGVLMFSLADPENPVFVGEYSPEYAHDSFVRNDTLFASTIYSPGGLRIVDIRNKSAPQFITKITYPGAGTHNAWTTEDGRYVLTTDEIGTTPKTLKFWDIRSLPAWSQVAEFTVDPTATVHNVHVKGRYAYVAWYTAGAHVVDVSNPEQPVYTGGYDTFPGTPTSPYNGCWGVFPYYNSNKFIACDRQTGLYVFGLDTVASTVRRVSEHVPDGFFLERNYPNPFNPTTVIEFGVERRERVALKIHDLLGREVATLVNGVMEPGMHRAEFTGRDLPSGVYFSRLTSAGFTVTRRMLLMK